MSSVEDVRAAQLAAESHIPTAPVSDAEVKRILDVIDGRRPYGSRRIGNVRLAAEILARDAEVYAFNGHKMLLSSEKVQGFARVVFADHPSGPSSEFSCHRALEGFLKQRGIEFEQAPVAKLPKKKPERAARPSPELPVIKVIRARPAQP
jgi:folate-dependent phosphoribosylglycinamide formyltransferase PurN